MRKLFFLLLLTVTSTFCFAQNQGNIWYFGDHAGIDFNSGTPVAINGPLLTNEGCSVICNNAGNVLFSTDGDTVYNSLGDTMGTGLFGNFSSTQSGVIVPFPGSNTNYYIFTADDVAGVNGICYSVVNMSLNGGLGGLVSINNPLLTPACEKITAVHNTNGTDYWVIVHAYPSAEFYVYPVTASGIGTPIITSIGLPINGTYNTIGYLKCSPNGEKLAAARYFVTGDPIELFDFDAGTGIISNCIPIPNNLQEYGISFSPDNSKLYVSIWIGSTINIQQYDLTLANFQNFPYTVYEGSGTRHAALQVAPDGKIYCSKYMENTLGVINNPNLADAACNYVDSGFVLLAGTEARHGLTNFIDGYFEVSCSLNSIADVTDNACNNGNTGSIDITTGGGNAPFIYSWSNGSTTEDLSGLDAGIYSLTITDNAGCEDTLTTTVTEPPVLNVTLTQSANADTIFANASGGISPYSYEWSTGATSSFITGMSSGSYTVTVTDAIGCTETFNIKFVGIKVLTTIADFEIYPNPASGQVTVVSGQLASHEIQITDILGRIITVHFHLTTVPYSVDVCKYSEGIYFIKLVSSSGITVVKKFVVVH